ncbi:AmmeMemoRadiSam system protein B [Candidatus Uhrbacteria bacterium]|nr:AmmeMemoRadiSam system protein B [Candidatus Uhrbacteria bacterium]
MKKSVWILLGLGALLIVALIICFARWLGPAASAPRASSLADCGRHGVPACASPFQRADLRINADVFLDQKSLIEAFATTKPAVSDCPNYRGGIVNHHVLAADLLAKFFMEMQRCRPDVTRIVILSPDHYQQSLKPFATFRDGYTSEGDAIAMDTEAIDQLLKNSSVTEDARLFKGEHGIAALIPFLHRVYPGVKVIPLVVRIQLLRKDAEGMVKMLKPLIDEKTVLIVSSDMSHYLTELKAVQNDEVTKKALVNRDADFFWSANDDFTDNGKSIWIAQTLFPDSTWTLQSQNISSRYDGTPAYTTTYLNGFWAISTP